MNPPQNQSAYPLAWPPTWPRVEAHRRRHAAFHSRVRGEASPGGYSHTYKRELSMSESTRCILGELRMLAATAIVISTNVELKLDGLPYSNRKAPEDPGAAIYFKLKGRAVVLACDKWRRVEDNLYAIAKHIEALRGQERWGVGTVEKAFAGYTALPAPGDSGAATWWAVLGVGHDAPFEVARTAYRDKAKLCHPDANGGSHEAMTRLTTAWDMARKAYGQN